MQNIRDIGPKVAQSIYNWFSNKHNIKFLEKLENVGKGTGLGNQLETDTQIYARAARIINILLGLVGIIATIYFIIAGVKWLRSGGNEQVITEAKATIRGAISGLIVVLASYIIVNFLVTRIIQAVA